MHVTQHLEKAAKQKKSIISIEVLPPLRGGGTQPLFKAIDALIDFAPAFINITHHQREFSLHTGPGGQPVLKQTHKRPGTIGVCTIIRERYKIDPVAHLIAAGHSEEELENILIELHYLGINNILALRGDRVKNDLLGENPYPHASKLVKQITNMNKGNYLHIAKAENDGEGEKTTFEIGVAGYPEKHYEAPNLKNDIERLAEKIKAGAKYVITQMFFDNKYYFNFVKQARSAGITVPIIPGLKPLSSKKHISSIPGFFHVDIPEEFASALKNAKDDTSTKEIGIEWCSQQVKELIAAGAPCIHFFSMGNGQLVKSVLKKSF